MSRLAVAAFVLVALGLGLGLQHARATDARLAALSDKLDRVTSALEARNDEPRTIALSPSPPQPQPIDAEALAARVAALVHPAPAADDKPATTPPPDPAAGESFESARAILSAAIDRGQLGPNDVRDLRARLEHASPDDRRELQRQIAVALNTGKLTPLDPRNVMP